MKLTPEQINKFKNKFTFELSESDLKKEWYFDREMGFQTIINPYRRRLINLKTSDNLWMKMDCKDLTQDQLEWLIYN